MKKSNKSKSRVLNRLHTILYLGFTFIYTFCLMKLQNASGGPLRNLYWINSSYTYILDVGLLQSSLLLRELFTEVVTSCHVKFSTG